MGTNGQTEWDLLREVCADEGIDAGALVADMDRRRAERAQYERENAEAIRAAEVASVEDKFIFDTDGEVLAPTHGPDDPCTVCDARRATVQRAARRRM